VERSAADHDATARLMASHANALASVTEGSSRSQDVHADTGAANHVNTVKASVSAAAEEAARTENTVLDFQDASRDMSAADHVAHARSTSTTVAMESVTATRHQHVTLDVLQDGDAENHVRLAEDMATSV